MSGPGNQPSGGGIFRNKKEKEAQEAARKSLEGMFKGKKDILASFDSGSGSGGGSKKSTGGGGNGGGGWQPPNWRAIGGNFGKGARGFGKAFLAILAFAGAIILIPVFPQLIAMIIGGVKTILLLDGRSLSGRRQNAINAAAFAGTSNLGPNESSVISKYGGNSDVI